jgi:ABC-type bacteriocin/lantibiotic exporter with double-glycine peptidase domain
MILDVKPFRQQQRWTCGPAAVRTVLYYQFGLDLTDTELSVVLATNRNGTSDFDGLKTLGFTFKESSAGNFKKLKKEIDRHRLPIVHILTPEGGHYVVVVGYDDDNIYVSDPETGKIVKHDHDWFFRIWHTEEHNKWIPWFLVITGRKKHRIASLIRQLTNVQRKLT